METRLIRHVLTVAEERSFSRAAERLRISQPGLSQSIRSLERRLGVPLFIRDSHGIRLTAAGQTFVATGQRVLDEVRQLSIQMDAVAANQIGQLRVGISAFYGLHHLPHVVPRFRSIYPSVQLTVTEAPSAELEKLAREGAVDVAMVPTPIVERGLSSTLLHEEEIYLAVPRDHPLNHRINALPHRPRGAEILALASHEGFVLLKPVQRFSALGLELCAAAGFAPEVVLETVNWDTVNSMVAAGLGIGFVPDVLVDAMPVHERPIYYQLGLAARRDYLAVWHGEPSPTTAMWTDLARRSIQSRMSRNSPN